MLYYVIYIIVYFCIYIYMGYTIRQLYNYTIIDAYICIDPKPTLQFYCALSSS